MTLIYVICHLSPLWLGCGEQQFRVQKGTGMTSTIISCARVELLQQSQIESAYAWDAGDICKGLGLMMVSECVSWFAKG